MHRDGLVLQGRISFSAMEKERRKKEEMLNFTDSLKIVVSDARVTMLNTCDSWVLDSARTD
jgi:hypothetical protein